MPEDRAWAGAERKQHNEDNILGSRRKARSCSEVENMVMWMQGLVQSHSDISSLKSERLKVDEGTMS